MLTESSPGEPLAALHRPAARRFLLLRIGACLALACIGCDRQTAVPAPDNSVKPPVQVVKSDLYLDGWGQPAAALVLSGEIHGYLEPCGCSPTQSGGFARRGHLLKELEKRGWPLAALDVGGLLKRPYLQDRIKLEFLLAGMQDMHYAGIGLGVEELQLGTDFLMTQYVPDAPGQPKSIPFLGANLVFYDSPDIRPPFPFQIVSVGDVKFGVTAVTGLSLKESVAPAGVDNHITFLDPAQALKTVVPLIQAEQPDVLVLLSHGTTEEARQLAEAFPEFRIILTAGGPEDASGKPIAVNDTWILETGMKGRAVGVLGYFPNDEKRPFRYELIELDNRRFLIDDRMTELMKRYQQRLIDGKVSQSDELKQDHLSGWQFVGAEQCGECHKKSYEHWKTTGHAKATDTLIHGRPGEEAHWVPRLFDPECLSCHVTGWEPQSYRRYDSGYLSEEASPHLRGQQCENCHGPGSQHTELERAFARDSQSVAADELERLRKAVRRSYDTAEKQICFQCHDAENSPKFKFEDFWEEVKHPWKD